MMAKTKSVRAMLAALVLALQAQAASVSLGPLPPGDFADAETVTNVPFVFPDADVHGLSFALELAGTPSNCVEAAFGRDADGDGALSCSETGLSVGWDCGCWMLRRRPDAWSAPAATTNRLRRLDIVFGVSRARAKRLDAHENGEPIGFGFAAEALPAGLYDRSWDTLRLTVRGVDRADESLRARLRAGGTVITIR